MNYIRHDTPLIAIGTPSAPYEFQFQGITNNEQSSIVGFLNAFSEKNGFSKPIKKKGNNTTVIHWYSEEKGIAINSIFEPRGQSYNMYINIVTYSYSPSKAAKAIASRLRKSFAERFGSNSLVRDYYCKTDNDCALVNKTCNQSHSVHKQSVSDFEQGAKTLQNLVKCADSSDWVDHPVAFCDNGICKVREKE